MKNLTYYLLLCAFLLGFAPVTHAEDDFKLWIKQFKELAVKKGYDPKMLKSAFQGLDEPLPEIVKKDRSQKEYTQTFNDYFHARDMDARVANIAKERSKELNSTLAKIESKYSPPGHLLLTLWDLESSRGRLRGKIPVVASVATLAWDKRRRRYFQQELFAVMDIFKQGFTDPESFTGSWAGASGHMQLMPSNIRDFGVDIDGDGKIDVWNSVADAMGSGARFLQRRGWEKGLRWAWEVEANDNFVFKPRKTKGLGKEWQQLGLSAVHGKLPKNTKLEFSAPAGASGPYFLLSKNYSIILRWNLSHHYALSVGILSDMVDNKPLKYLVPTSAKQINKVHIVELQNKLKKLGIFKGASDGVLGPETNGAITMWRKKFAKAGKKKSRRIDFETYQSILASKTS